MPYYELVSLTCWHDSTIINAVETFAKTFALLTTHKFIRIQSSIYPHSHIELFATTSAHYKQMRRYVYVCVL